MATSIQLIPYAPKYKQAFIDLNINWLEEYFVVEPYDQKILEQCEEVILEKGGHIFFALHDEEVVGTFAFIRASEGVYELGKMAVAKTKRGLGIGNQMMAFSIRFAEKHHWNKLFLYSSSLIFRIHPSNKPRSFFLLSINIGPLNNVRSLCTAL